MLTIATLADKHPDFVKYQNDSIKKHVTGEWNHVVFNNAEGTDMRNAINVSCNEIGVETIQLYCNYVTHGSAIQGEAMDKAWREHLKDRPGGMLWIDIDMFFIAPINTKQFTEDYDIGYVPIYRNNFELECMWAGLIFLNSEKIDKNIEFGLKNINGTPTDTGGSTYYYLNAHPEYKRLFFGMDTIYEFEDNRIKTALNGCSGYISFLGNVPDIALGKRLFPHEAENENYAEKYRLRFENHKNIIKQYSFPQPYDFDLMRMEGNERPFIFHYKSASWDPKYGNAQYSNDKREALRKLLSEGKL